MSIMNKKNKKNIAIMIAGLAGGGAEREASELSQFFVGEGHNVFIFTENIETGYVFSGEIVKLNIRRDWSMFPEDIVELIRVSREIKRLKKELKIDIAISFLDKYNLANVLSKGKEKVIVKVSTTLSKRDDCKGLYHNKWLIHALYNRADRVIVLSRYGKRDMMENYRIKSKKLLVLPNAVIPRRICKNDSWEYGDNVILSVNRIAPVKQQGILLDVIQKIRDRIPDAKLLLVGNDKNAYAYKLKKEVRQRGLEEVVVFTGHVTDVEYYMHHSKILVFTSYVEGVPNVALEGMNQGIPIISTDFPSAMRELLGISDKLGYGKYGIMTPMINENEKDASYEIGIDNLCSVLFEVMTNPILIQKYREASKRRAKYYAKDRIESLWKKIL